MLAKILQEVREALLVLFGLVVDEDCVVVAEAVGYAGHIKDFEEIRLLVELMNGILGELVDPVLKLGC